MSKQLIIAEKPSVAQDIARALGGFHKEKDFFESEQYVLSSAVGHLLELTLPEEYEVKRGKWSFAHLPVIPPHFALKPVEKTEDRLKLLTRLIKRKDVEGLINACDAGREGELIFNYIAQHSGSKKPVRRLWLQSMTQGAIRDGFQSLREASEMAGLRAAAISRAESDWLIGINGTRAMTAFNSKTGGFHLTTVGRVQTPTLAIVVEREERIRRFVARAYWELEARFAERKASTPDAGSTRSSSASKTTSTPAPTGCGNCRAPRRFAPPAWASRHAPRKKPNHPASSRHFSMTSPACSARPTAVSASRPRPRWAWRRRCMKSTRC